MCNVYRYKCNNKENDDEGVLLYMIKLQCLLVPVVVDICFFLGKNVRVMRGWWMGLWIWIRIMDDAAAGPCQSSLRC